jgi:DNA-binding winged helix-turn-helix (wHTH) protein
MTYSSAVSLMPPLKSIVILRHSPYNHATLSIPGKSTMAGQSFAPQPVLRFGEFSMDIRSRELHRNGVRVRVEDQPLLVLAALLERPGQLVPREDLQRKLWGAHIHVDYDHGLDKAINKLREILGDNGAQQEYVETLRGRGYRFIAEVSLDAVPPTSGGSVKGSPAIPLPLDSSGARPIQGGALPISSKCYLRRLADRICEAAVVTRESIICIKGPKQAGKSSLLARVLEHARSLGFRTVVSDLEKYSNELQSPELILKALACELAEQLGLECCPSSYWNPQRAPSANIERVLRSQILVPGAQHLVWALDNADRMIEKKSTAEIFGLFRAWHNARALEPGGPWSRLSIVIVHSSEPHLFIPDLSQSPFNVGTRIELPDFSRAEVGELHSRYVRPFKLEDEVDQLYRLLGGHPLLTHSALSQLSNADTTMEDLLRDAATPSGPFRGPLKSLLLSVSRDSTLLDGVRQALKSGQVADFGAFYRLRSCGILTGDSASEVAFRCSLYETFFRSQLP